MNTQPNGAVYTLMRLVREKAREARLLQTAGSLTYTTLLSLVPMITVILAVMRQFTPFAKLGDGMRAFLLQNLLPEKAGKVIATYALQFSDKASSLTVVGTVFLVVTAVMLFQTIDHTFNSIWGVRRPRPWYVRIPVYWLALTLGPVLFAGSIAATGELLSVSLGLVNEPSWVRSLLERVSTALLMSALFAYMFHAVPNRRLLLQNGIVGGLVAGVGVMLVQKLFGLYISRLPNFTLIYGTFSVVPIFLIWVYFTWLAILLGAVVAAVLPEFAARRSLAPTSAAGRLLAALRLLRALSAAQVRGEPIYLNVLAQEACQTESYVDALLEDLRAKGWAVRTEDGAWMLCVAATQIRAGDWLMLLLAGPGFRLDEASAQRTEDDALLQASLQRLCERMPQPATGLLPD